MVEQILESSTPDGVAPMSFMALYIFTFCFTGVAIVWGVINFIMLLRIGPQNQEEGLIVGNSQTEQIRQMGFKILMGSIHYMKFNFVVIFAASLIYFLVILGAVESWSPSLCGTYLHGAFSAFLCSLYTVIITAFSYFRIVYSAKYSASDAFGAAKRASNSITFVCVGITVGVIMAISILSDPVEKSDIEEINHRGNELLALAFGYATVCICSKITTLIYSQGIQNSFQIQAMFDMKNLNRDSKNPMVICKAIAETINKSMSKTVDFLVFIPSIVGLVMKVAGMNVLGVDQKGEIVFQLSADNIFTALLLFTYALFFSLIISLWKGSPENQSEVKMHFRINIVGITVFLSGFTALACYLTLPAEYQLQQFIDEDNSQVFSPIYAYLIVLIGMFISILISLTAEIKSSGLKFIYDLMKSCKTGPATCLISGLSKGYSYTFIPAVIISPFGFLCYYWLGNFGVGLGAVGIGMFIPYYINVNLYHSIMNCASMIGLVSKQGQNSSTSVESLLALNQSKKAFEQKIYVYYNQLAILLTYIAIAVFAQYSNEKFSIQEPHLFLGLLTGAMLPYVFSALIIRAAFGVAPVICYDVQEQLEENPNAAKGKGELDYYRSNHIFVLNSTLRILIFLPLLIAPTLITGIALSLQSTLGFMAGLGISSFQFSISSSMSGTLWRNVRDQIAYGRAKDEDNDDIGIDSEWGKAAEIGNSVGSSIKQSSGQSSFVYVIWTVIMASVFEDLYIKIHSD